MMDLSRDVLPESVCLYFLNDMHGFEWYSLIPVFYTLDSSFCVEALEEAIANYVCPEIFNTDQGSQFTEEVFTDTLYSNDIKISMDGKGRWMDNILLNGFGKV